MLLLPPLQEWYLITIDENNVHLDVAPPGEDAWTDSFSWDSVDRICFKDEGPYSSDLYYVFVNGRPESYVIPVEASGGEEFVEKVLARNLFDKKLFTKAMRETDGAMYCWPEE